MIADVIEREEDQGDVHFQWIRHEAHDARGVTPLNCTLGVSRAGKTVSVNFAAGMPREAVIQIAVNLLNQE